MTDAIFSTYYGTILLPECRRPILTCQATYTAKSGQKYTVKVVDALNANITEPYQVDIPETYLHQFSAARYSRADNRFYGLLICLINATDSTCLPMQRCEMNKEWWKDEPFYVAHVFRLRDMGILQVWSALYTHAESLLSNNNAVPKSR